MPPAKDRGARRRAGLEDERRDAPLQELGRGGKTDRACPDDRDGQRGDVHSVLQWHIAEVEHHRYIDACQYPLPSIYWAPVDDVRLFQALADPTRLAIVKQLASDGEVCACDFTSCCDVSQPTVSHHLRV